MLSPCVNVCRLDADKICVGCRRTLAEIAGWRDMSAAQRRAVLARLRAHGGRAGGLSY